MRFAWLAMGLVFILFVDAGCSKKIYPGITYNIWIIARDKAGKMMPQGETERIEGARVESMQELTHEGQPLSLLVRKTQYGKATFEVTFPDKTRQMFQVKAGETKDILPTGQKFGVRIELHESH